MYTIEEFDKEKTRILKYILYKKFRNTQQICNKISLKLLFDMLSWIKSER